MKRFIGAFCARLNRATRAGLILLGQLVLALLMLLSRHLDDIVWLAGSAIVAYGTGTIYEPAGVIVAGLALLYYGRVLGVSRSGPPGGGRR